MMASRKEKEEEEEEEEEEKERERERERKNRDEKCLAVDVPVLIGLDAKVTALQKSRHR